MMKHALMVCFCLAAPLSAQRPIALTETVVQERIYSIDSKVEITGTLTIREGKEAKSIGVTGRSSIAYFEKMLPPLPDVASRSLRLYRQVELHRSLNDRPTESTIRPSVRRMVILRSGTREVPFSPDGPLTFAEVDLVRTDLFTPTLIGLLPAQAVQVGDTWPAALSAVEELTDFEKIDQGNLECRFVGLDGQNAKVAFAGEVTGVNEDGPVRQRLEGTLAFDMADKLITSLALTGIKTLLDGDGKATGRVEGKFTMTRKLASAVPELSDDRLRGITLEPDKSNTLLVYESVANLRLTHSRRWRVSSEQGRQVTLEDRAGNGILITMEPLEKVPAIGDYVKEAQSYVSKQKGRVIKADPATKLRPYPKELDRFGMDIEIDGRKARMEYAVIRQSAGGATLAARLLPENAASLREEIDSLARELQIGPVAPAGVQPIPGK